MISKIALFVLLLCSRTTLAQTERESIGSFISPGPSSKTQPPLSQNAVWELGSIQNIRWNFTTPISAYSMDIVPLNVSGETATRGGQFGIYTKYASEQEKGDFDWVVTADSYDVAIFPVFMVEMTTFQDDKGFSYSFQSEFFNISKGDMATTIITSTAARPTSSALSRSATNTIMSTTSSPSGARLPSSESTSQSSLTTQKDGDNLPMALGVGLGVGIPATIAIAALAAWRLLHRRYSASDDQKTDTTAGLAEKSGDDYKTPVELPLVAEKQAMELSSEREERNPQELPAYERKEKAPERQELP